MFKESESRPDKIESTSNNVQAIKKQQHRRRACDLLASLKRFYWPNTRVFACDLLAALKCFYWPNTRIPMQFDLEPQVQSKCANV